MKKIYTLLIFCLSSTIASAQFYSVSTNAVDLAMTNVNIELGMGVSRKYTLHLPIVWNPWQLNSENKKIKQLTFLPQGKYWLTESYLRWFLASNLMISRYNWSPKNIRYDGMGYGGGISAGYNWILSKHWNLEAQAGIGFGYFNYKKYECGFCGDFYGREKRWFVYPNRVSLSIVYLF